MLAILICVSNIFIPSVYASANISSEYDLYENNEYEIINNKWMGNIVK